MCIFSSVLLPSEGSHILIKQVSSGIYSVRDDKGGPLYLALSCAVSTATYGHLEPRLSSTQGSSFYRPFCRSSHFPGSRLAGLLALGSFHTEFNFSMTLSVNLEVRMKLLLIIDFNANAKFIFFQPQSRFLVQKLKLLLFLIPFAI